MLPPLGARSSSHLTPSRVVLIGLVAFAMVGVAYPRPTSSLSASSSRWGRFVATFRGVPRGPLSGPLPPRPLRRRFRFSAPPRLPPFCSVRTMAQRWDCPTVAVPKRHWGICSYPATSVIDNLYARTIGRRQHFRLLPNPVRRLGTR